MSCLLYCSGSALALLVLILALPLYIEFQGEIRIWNHHAIYAVIVSWTSANLLQIMYHNYTGDQNWICKCTKAGVSCHCVSDQIRTWKQQLLALIVRRAPSQFCRQIWMAKIKWLFTSHMYTQTSNFCRFWESHPSLCCACSHLLLPTVPL